MARDNQANALDRSLTTGPKDDLVHNEEVEDFFTRMKYDLRRPKPASEDVEAAREAIERLTIQADADGHDSAGGDVEAKSACPACGNENPPSHKFCGTCGIPMQQDDSGTAGPMSVRPETAIESAIATTPAGQHHYHHHYHHYLSGDQSPSLQSGATPPAKDPLRARAVLGGPPSNRADAAVRKLAQDWSVACNTKHLDDLVELYATDAIVLRPNVPAIRGTAAIREFLFTAMDAGLGEVELEALRVDVFGDVAYEAGRSKMVVPVAMSKRREERGKYVIISTRTAGEWKIVCDMWSSDLSLQSVAETNPARGVIPLPLRNQK